MAGKGWHMSNPTQNGKAITNLIHNGSHKKYNEIVQNILEELGKGKISSATPTADALNTMNKLRDELTTHIDKAVQSGQSMSKYF